MLNINVYIFILLINNNLAGNIYNIKLKYILLMENMVCALFIDLKIIMIIIRDKTSDNMRS